MTTSLSIFHHAEMLPESGGMYGNSATSALGRPDLESWELFTRETLQNSWDARDRTSHDDGVTFSIDYIELRAHRAQALREFFDSGTEGLSALRKVLDPNTAESIPLLLVSDTGTTGLQGPTSAAKNTAGRTDFASFVRNIGRPSSKELRGGTYGFGKGVFFNVSGANTVLVYTRTVDEHQQPVERFIAMSNSDSFTLDNAIHTGRHWWGIESRGQNGNVFVEPLTGLDAGSLARHFRMDQHFTVDRPTGTTIAVIDPGFNNESIDTVLEKIANSLTKWAWPHMAVNVDHMDQIEFSVTKEGSPIAIPDPLSDPMLAPFVKAYKTCLKEPEHLAPTDFVKEFQRIGKRRWIDINSERPREYLGRLAVVNTNTDQVPSFSVLEEDVKNHVALMRSPRMVVTYWKGPAQDDGESYAGVFLAAEHLDTIFAGSEPPAHDEWNPKTVDLKDPRFVDPKTGKARSTNPVNRALAEIKKNLRPVTKVELTDSATEDISSITSISNELGSIFSGASGTSSKVRTKPTVTTKPKPVRKKGVSSSIILDDLIETPEGLVSLFKVNVNSTEEALSRDVYISIYPAVILDGKRETGQIDGVEPPTSLGWIQTHNREDEILERVSNFDQDSDHSVRMRSAHWEGYFAVLQPKDLAIAADIVVQFEAEEDA